MSYCEHCECTIADNPCITDGEVATCPMMRIEAKDTSKRPMSEIPISAAKCIADSYGYDQVIIIARRVGDIPEPHGEHVTTYGIDKENCGVAARIGNFIKHKIMGWPYD